MTRSIPLPELAGWLAEELAPGREDTAILAGHFAIFTAGAAAIDLLDDPAPAAAAVREMVDFTRLTWRAAVEALAAAGTDTSRLVVLVDDIQFVRPTLGDKSKEERLAAALAEGYLAKTPTLPAFHLRELHAHGILANRIVRHGDDRWLFSERELRIAAVRRLRRTPLTPGLADLAASADGQTVTVTLPEQGEYCLVHSGRTTCAGGYLELLASLHQRGIRRLVALVPQRCLGPITLGTMLARQLVGVPGLEVVNVAIPDPALSLPARVVPSGA